VLYIPYPKNPHKTKMNMVRLRQLPAKLKGGKYMEVDITQVNFSQMPQCSKLLTLLNQKR